MHAQAGPYWEEHTTTGTATSDEATGHWRGQGRPAGSRPCAELQQTNAASECSEAMECACLHPCTALIECTRPHRKGILMRLIMNARGLTAMRWRMHGCEKRVCSSWGRRRMHSAWHAGTG